MQPRHREELHEALVRLRQARYAIDDVLTERERQALNRYERELLRAPPDPGTLRRAFLELTERVTYYVAPMPTLRPHR